MLLTISGFALSLWLPLNKRIWSPSFVLATCGLAMLLLSLIMKIEQWSPSSMNKGGWVVLLVFGMNPLFLYVLSAKWASLCYALTFVLLNWLVGYVLYRKKIFIKI